MIGLRLPHWMMVFRHDKHTKTRSYGHPGPHQGTDAAAGACVNIRAEADQGGKHFRFLWQMGHECCSEVNVRSGNSLSLICLSMF